MAAEETAGAAAIAPAALEAHHPAGSVLAGTGYGWDALSLQHWRLPPGALAAPPLDRHLISVHVGGHARLSRRLAGERGRETHSRHGAFSLTPAGNEAAWRWDRPVEVVNLFIPQQAVADVVLRAFERDPRSCTLVDIVGRAEPLFLELGRAMLTEYQSGFPGGRLLAEAIATTAAYRLVRSYSTLTAAPRLTGGLNGRRLNAVLAYMHAHLDADISLAALASVSGLSERHFLRAFRTAMGISPHRHLVQLRLDRARTLLLGSDLPVTEIALACGFSQPGHFSTAFRRSFAASPSRFREQARR